MFNRPAKPEKNRSVASPVFTILGEGTRWQGEVQAGKDGLRIEGELEGSLVSDGLVVVAPKGLLKGTVRARHLTVTGRVEGIIRVTECLEIMGSGWVEGEVEMGTLVVDEGGILQGNCVRLSPTPIKEPAPLHAHKEDPGAPGGTPMGPALPQGHGRDLSPIGRGDRGRF